MLETDMLFSLFGLNAVVATSSQMLCKTNAGNIS
jgi:hypothetical protein